jgi:hypothetical protein
MSTDKDAQAMVVALEQRLDNVEALNAANASQTGGAVDSAAMKAYQAKMLVRLKEIRAALADGDAGAMKKERDEALAENARLQKELERANYRVNHLVKELNSAEAATGSANTSASATAAPAPAATASAAPTAAATAAPEKKKSLFSSIFG